MDGFTGGREGREGVLLDGAPTTVAAVEVEEVAAGVPGTVAMVEGPVLEADVDDIESGPIEGVWMEGIVICPPAVVEPIEDTDKEGTIPCGPEPAPRRGLPGV